MPEWWRKNKKKAPIHNKEFEEILQFFLYECPVQYKDGRPVSARAITFEMAGVTDTKLTALGRRLKRLPSVKNHFCEVKNNVDFVTYEKEIKERQKGANHIEFMCCVPNSELGQTRSIFYSLRNALAHGSFSIVTGTNGLNYYYLEAAKSDKLKFRACLSGKTLKKWIVISKEALKGDT